MIGCLRTRVRKQQIIALYFESFYNLGPEIIKLEYSLKLKKKQPIIALYFEFENELEFYNLEISWCTINARTSQYFTFVIRFSLLHLVTGTNEEN